MRSALSDDLLAGRSDKPNFTMGGHKPVSINAPPAAADAAHRSGARLASLSAKHAFALGVVGGGALGATYGVGAGLRAGRMLSDKQRAERRTAALARWKNRGQAPAAQGAAPMGKMAPLRAGFHKIGLPTGNGLWSGKAGETCPTCGTMAKMAKGATPQPGTRVIDMTAAAQAVAATHVAEPVTKPVPVDGKCPTCGSPWDGTEPQAASSAPRQAPISAPSVKATTSNGGSVDAQPWTLSGISAAQERWAKQKMAMG